MKANIKSIVMKSAWMLYRTYSMSWKEAMLKSWGLTKQSIKVISQKTYSGVVRLVFSKDGVTTDSIDKLLETVKNQPVFDNSGAANYYDGRTLNLD